MLRAVKIVLTWRPCSGATSATKKRDRVWYREAAAGWSSAEPATLRDIVRAAVTISRRYGAVPPITGLASAWAANGRTSPAAAKNRAAGASTAASATGDLRRFLANRW